MIFHRKIIGLRMLGTDVFYVTDAMANVPLSGTTPPCIEIILCPAERKTDGGGIPAHYLVKTILWDIVVPFEKACPYFNRYNQSGDRHSAQRELGIRADGAAEERKRAARFIRWLLEDADVTGPLWLDLVDRYERTGATHDSPQDKRQRDDIQDTQAGTEDGHR